MPAALDVALAVLDPAPCWCRSQRWQVRFRTRRFGLLRCAACGTFRIDPRPLASQAEAGGFYSEYYAGLVPEVHGGGRRSSRFWRVVEQVPGLAVPHQRALDIGCGDGHLCAELARAGWAEVIGIDLSRPRIERARERYPHLHFYGSLDEAGIEEGSLDLVVLDNVIEHLLDPRAELQNLVSRLRPTGRLVVITPSLESGHYRLLGRRWTPELAPHHHVFLFTSRSLAQMLGHAGLALEATGSFHLPLYSWRRWVRLVAALELREAAWRVLQEAGSVYGRMICAGAMLYAVARPQAAPVREPAR